jgi:hypothetical protein
MSDRVSDMASENQAFSDLFVEFVELIRDIIASTEPTTAPVTANSDEQVALAYSNALQILEELGSHQRGDVPSREFLKRLRTVVEYQFAPVVETIRANNGELDDGAILGETTLQDKLYQVAERADTFVAGFQLDANAPGSDAQAANGMAELENYRSMSISLSLSSLPFQTELARIGENLDPNLDETDRLEALNELKRFSPSDLVCGDNWEDTRLCFQRGLTGINSEIQQGILEIVTHSFRAASVSIKGELYLELASQLTLQFESFARKSASGKQVDILLLEKTVYFKSVFAS